jgi:hypothetical protein
MAWSQVAILLALSIYRALLSLAFGEGMQQFRLLLILAHSPIAQWHGLCWNKASKM